MKFKTLLFIGLIVFLNSCSDGERVTQLQNEVDSVENEYKIVLEKLMECESAQKSSLDSALKKYEEAKRELEDPK